jgi:hypothetical protein
VGGEVLGVFGKRGVEREAMTTKKDLLSPEIII